MTARIHDIVGHHCSVSFERNGQRFTARNVNIAIFADEPSPNLMRLLATQRPRWVSHDMRSMPVARPAWEGGLIMRWLNIVGLIFNLVGAGVIAVGVTA